MYVKVSCWILRDWILRGVGGGPNGVGTYKAMHLASLEYLGFRNLNVNTTDYCYRQYIYI